MSDARDAVLASVIAPATKEVERLTDEIAELQAKIDALKEERKPFERVIRAATPKAKPGAKGAKPSPKVAEETRGRVFAFIKEQWPNGDEFTATHVEREAKARGLGFSGSTIHYAVKELREADRIRLVRRGTGGSAILKVAG
jgi:predicted RNase H-like nuclease (RuvC/YqgF family)